MELLKKTMEAIQPLHEDKVKEAQERLDGLLKPLGSLGKLETIAVQMAGITGNVHNTINKKSIIVMCSDNGVVKEGVSSCPRNVTTILTNNFPRKNTGVGVLADLANSDLTVVDIGVDDELTHPQIINRKISYGTKNMAKGPAMTKEQVMEAIEIGIETVDGLVQQGYNLLGTGEMGIGNTSTSSAILSVLSGIDSDRVVGKGAGMTEEQYNLKKKVIKEAINLNQPDASDVIDVLSKVGGYDIAGLCGCFIGAAKNRVPIVIDGFISSVAALCAYKLNPLVKEFMITSHHSAEPGALYVMQELGLETMLNMNMRLGEGSGCPMSFFIIESALQVMNNMTTFEEVMLEKDYLVDIR